MNQALPDREARRERHRRSRPQSSLFRTHTLAPSERFGAWRESMDVMLDSRLSDRDDPGAFTGEVEGYLLNDILLTRAVAGRQKYDRPSSKIARDGLDHYMFQIFLGGHTELNLGRRAVRSEAGRVIAFDFGDVLDSHNTDFDILCIVVPRARLAPLLPRSDSLQGAMPERDGAAGHLLADYLHSLYRVAPSLTPLEEKTSIRALLELTASAFSGAGADAQARQHALLLKAQNFIRANLSSSGLSPEAIALGIGLSRTALYRLFERVGGVAEYVRELRLRRCLSDLTSPRHAHKHVSQIAFCWGFTNQAHFTRAFRQRFGRAPGEMRIHHDTITRQERMELDSRVGDRRYEEWIAGLA